MVKKDDKSRPHTKAMKTKACKKSLGRFQGGHPDCRPERGKQQGSVNGKENIIYEGPK